MSGQSVTINVAPITPLLALPNTIGFLEVHTSIALNAAWIAYTVATSVGWCIMSLQ